jgi:t-SNARE complex subunit (syntaxin)
MQMTFFFSSGEANAILAKANARAEAILKVAESLSLKVSILSVFETFLANLTKYKKNITFERKSFCV